jgi:hypothetical protein
VRGSTLVSVGMTPSSGTGEVTDDVEDTSYLEEDDEEQMQDTDSGEQYTANRPSEEEATEETEIEPEESEFFSSGGEQGFGYEDEEDENEFTESGQAQSEDTDSLVDESGDESTLIGGDSNMPHLAMTARDRYNTLIKGDDLHEIGLAVLGVRGLDESEEVRGFHGSDSESRRSSSLLTESEKAAPSAGFPGPAGFSGPAEDYLLDRHVSAASLEQYGEDMGDEKPFDLATETDVFKLCKITPLTPEIVKR